MANETMQMSAAGRTTLRQRERLELRYYEDVANNCTYGIGTLAHHGPCTAEEKRRTVTADNANAQFVTGVRDAEAAVRRQVRTQPLTQAQFDALASFTYNLGARNARKTLGAANKGAFNEVVRHMSSNVYIHPIVNGRRLAPARSPGLVKRRREETAPFQTPTRNR